MSDQKLLGMIIEEAFQRKTWHGPNLLQSVRGVSSRQAAWRPQPGRHNIWEEVLHAAYWKYVVRRRIEGGKRGSFVLKGSNFFPRPEKGRFTQAAWEADKALLVREHRALVATIAKATRQGKLTRFIRLIFGVAFHDVYHAGQIRLLRRLQE